MVHAWRWVLLGGSCWAWSGVRLAGGQRMAWGGMMLWYTVERPGDERTRTHDARARIRDAGARARVL